MRSVCLLAFRLWPARRCAQGHGGAQLSILAILDMGSKQLPIGTPQNYLFALEPRLHGLDNPEAPSLVSVLVVNGNLPTPSSWSRKKTPVHDTPGQKSQGV
jgi:hypothetical protein